MNVHASIGHNQSPFHIATNRIQDLFDEAKNWLDGEPLETKEQHDTLVDLVKQIRAAKKVADDLRKEEAKPFDEGKAEIQTRYNPFIQANKGLADLAIKTANDALAPYLAAQLKLKRDEEMRLREEAAQKEFEAREALKASQGNLAERQEADALVTEAKRANAIANKAAKTNIAKGARTVWNVEISNVKIAGTEMWRAFPERFHALILEMAKEQVRAGRREIAGFTITETKAV